MADWDRFDELMKERIELKYKVDTYTDFTNNQEFKYRLQQLLKRDLEVYFEMKKIVEEDMKESLKKEGENKWD